MIVIVITPGRFEVAVKLPEVVETNPELSGSGAEKPKHNFRTTEKCYSEHLDLILSGMQSLKEDVKTERSKEGRRCFAAWELPGILHTPSGPHQLPRAVRQRDVLMVIDVVTPLSMAAVVSKQRRKQSGHEGHLRRNSMLDRKQ